MAKRKSWLTPILKNKIEEAINKTIAMHFADSRITMEPILHMLEAAAAAKKTFEGALPTPLGKYQDVHERNHVILSIPLHDLKTSLDHISIGNGDGMIRYKEWSEIMNRPSSVQSRNVPALTFAVSTDFAFPCGYMTTASQHERLSRPSDSLLLTPDVVPADWYDEAERLYKLRDTLEYMRVFSMSVAGFCTTPGITKRIWPEAKSFVGGRYQKEIAAANTSQYPGGFRSRIRDLDGGEDSVSLAYVSKQLKSIADMIIAAELMPDCHNHWEVQRCRVLGDKIVGTRISTLLLDKFLR